MAVVYIQEFAFKDWSTANYDWAKEQIGDDPIDGLIVHTAGFDKDASVFRIMDVWESQEQAKRFIEERVHPMMEKGVDAPPNPRTPPAHARDVLRASRRECSERDGFRTIHCVIHGKSRRRLVNGRNPNVSRAREPFVVMPSRSRRVRETSTSKAGERRSVPYAQERS